MNDPGRGRGEGGGQGISVATAKEFDTRWRTREGWVGVDWKVIWYTTIRN